MAACGGGDELTAKGAIEEQAQVVCETAFKCMSSYPAGLPISFELLFGTSAAMCTTTFTRDAAAVQAAVDAGKIEFDADAAASCIAFGEGLSCPDFWGNLFEDMPASPASCDTAFVGKVAIGGACTTSLECAGADTTCDDTTNTCEM